MTLFFRFDPSKIHDLLLHDSGFDQEMLTRVRGIGGGISTPRHGKPKTENAYAFLSGMYNENDVEPELKRHENPSAILSKNPTPSEKKVQKHMEETSPAEFLDKILSYNMTPVTTLTKNPFVSEEVRMVLDRELGDVGTDGPRNHKYHRMSTFSKLPLAVTKKTVKEESKEKTSARGRSSDGKKKKPQSGVKEKSEAEEIIDISKKISKLIEYDPSKQGEQTLVEVMPSIEYSVAEMLERILEDEERQEEDEQLQALEVIVKPQAIKLENELVFDTLESFLHNKIDPKADLEMVSQREQFLMQEFKDFKPKEMEKQKNQLTNANMKQSKLTIHNVHNLHGKDSNFEEFLSPRSKTMKDEEWKQRDKAISELCTTLEKLIIDMCNEMKQLNESKLNTAITPRFRDIANMSDTLITCLKHIPFDWNSRTKREWAQGAEVLLMWEMNLSSTLNITREEHVKMLARFYVSIFYENDVLMKNLFLHYKDAVIEEIKKEGDIQTEMKEEIKLPRINSFSVWSDALNSEVDEVDLLTYPQSFELQRHRVTSIKKLLFIIINYVNHCNSYTKDVFSELVLIEKENRINTVTARKESLKESGQQKQVRSFIEERGLGSFVTFLSTSKVEPVRSGKIGKLDLNEEDDDMDTEVHVHKEKDFYSSMFNKDVGSIIDNIRISKSAQRIIYDEPIATPQPVLILEEQDVEPNITPQRTPRKSLDDFLLYKTSVVSGQDPNEEITSMEYQRSYFYTPPNIKDAKISPTISNSRKLDNITAIKTLVQNRQNDSICTDENDVSGSLVNRNQNNCSSNSLMYTPSEHSFIATDVSPLDKNDSELLADKQEPKEIQIPFEERNTNQENRIDGQVILSESPNELSTNLVDTSDTVSLHSIDSQEKKVSPLKSVSAQRTSSRSQQNTGDGRKSSQNDGRKSSSKNPGSKRATPEISSIHESKAKNLRRYTLQRNKSSQSTDGAKTPQSAKIVTQDFTPTRSLSPISQSQGDFNNKFNMSFDSTLDETALRLSSRGSSNSLILRDDSPRSVKTTTSTDKKINTAGKWALKTTVFQSFFDSPLRANDDLGDTKKKEESYDRFDSVALLEKLEQTWDELLIPATAKMKLYQKYSNSKYVGNVNLIKDAVKIWKQGAIAITARESVILQLNQFEKTLSESATKVPSFLDKIQEQKIRSNLFNRMSVIASECEKINRRLKKDHGDQLIYNSVTPYIEKMKSDYLSIVAGIELWEEQMQPISYDVISPRSSLKKHASVTVSS